jgi:hypothetical protein
MLPVRAIQHSSRLFIIVLVNSSFTSLCELMGYRAGISLSSNSPPYAASPDFNVIHYKHTHGFSPVKTAPSRDALVNASPALVSSFVLCGKANRRTSKIMGR